MLPLFLSNRGRWLGGVCRQHQRTAEHRKEKRGRGTKKKEKKREVMRISGHTELWSFRKYPTLCGGSLLFRSNDCEKQQLWNYHNTGSAIAARDTPPWQLWQLGPIMEVKNGDIEISRSCSPENWSLSLLNLSSCLSLLGCNQLSTTETSSETSVCKFRFPKEISFKWKKKNKKRTKRNSVIQVILQKLWFWASQCGGCWQHQWWMCYLLEVSQKKSTVMKT